MTIAAAKTDAGGDLRRPLMLIDGDWVASGTGRTLSVENPAKRRPIAEVPRADAEDVDRAVQAAAAAFPAWSKVTPRDRGRMLLRIADALEARTEELARLIALETGNALRTQARGEAAQLQEAASAYKSRVVLEAQGEAQRFVSVYDEYAKAPDVTRKRLFLETMESVLKGSNKVIVEQGNGQGVVPYLPLPELNNRTNTGTRTQQGGNQ